MRLEPHGRIDLEHRAYFLRGDPQNFIIAASQDGHVALSGREFKNSKSHRLASSIRAASVHPTELCFAWVDGESGSLIVQSLHGDRLFALEAPPLLDGASKWLKRGFEDCFFDASGKYLWLAAIRRDDVFELHLLETRNWTIVDHTVVKDEFGGSAISFQHTGKPELTSLWVAGGQDGQAVYWLRLMGSGFTCEQDPRLRNSLAPSFSPNGEHFLVADEDGAVCQFHFPTLQQIGLPLTTADEDADPFAESLCYFDDRLALASTNEGRIFVIDTENMTIAEEASIPGHEPRPVGEYYPRLADEPGLATDISHFVRLGRYIVFVYRRDRSTALEGWKDTVLWFKAPA